LESREKSTHFEGITDIWEYSREDALS